MLPPVALAQTDIPVSQIGPYVTIGRQLNWGAVGVGGINNGFVFTPYQPDTGVCFSVYNNNPTSAHTFDLRIFTTPDPMSVGIFSNATHWQILNFTSAYTVPPVAMATYFLKTAGSAKIEIVITGSTTLTGTPDTADLVMAQSASGCGSVTGNSALQMSAPAPPATIISTIPLNARSGIFCDLSTVLTVPTGTTVTLATTSSVHVCAYQVSGPVTTTDAQIQFAPGTAGTCATPAITPSWAIDTGIGIPSYALSAAQGQLFQTFTEPLCVTNTGTGTTVTVSLATANF